MELLKMLKEQAVGRGLVELDAELDPAAVFALVRDMPYIRASDRRPETTISEWRGTCSGKHYLLKELFAELGLPSKVIACTTVAQLDLDTLPAELREALTPTNGRFVDVHNYLILPLPDGREMVVDATWPLATQSLGFVVNERFEMGVDQQIAGPPIENWVIEEGQDPQTLKDEILETHFTPEELVVRDRFIGILSELLKEVYSDEVL